MGWLSWAIGFGLPSLTGIAALGLAAWAWFAVPVIGRYAGLGLVALGVGLLAYAQGYSSARGECQDAALRAQLAAVQADLDAAMRSARVAQQLGEMLDEAEKRNQDLLNDIEAIKDTPDACLLDADGARRLLRLK